MIPRDTFLLILHHSSWQEFCFWRNIDMEVALSTDCTPLVRWPCLLGKEPPKLMGYSFTTGEGNWDARISPCFPWLYLLHWGCQLSCCGGLRTTHTLCIPCVCVMFMLVIYTGRQLKAPKYLVHSKIPLSILPLPCYFPQGRQWAQNEMLKSL